MLDVCKACGGRASHGSLRHVKQSKRRCTVPVWAHPRTCGTSPGSQTKLWQSANLKMPDKKWQTARLDSDNDDDSDVWSSEDDEGEEASESAATAMDEEDASESDVKKPKNHRSPSTKSVPVCFEDKVDLMMTQLKCVYDSVQGKTGPGHMHEAYVELRTYSMWNTLTVQKHFPLERFSRYHGLQIPVAGNMTVSKDRQKWSCAFCKTGQKDMSWHKQNALKHFRSEKHFRSVREHLQQTKSLEEAVETRQHYDVYAQEIPQVCTRHVHVSPLS